MKTPPPQLEEIEELHSDSGYGLRMRFLLGAVPIERWRRGDRSGLGRFFAKGMRAELKELDEQRLDVVLLPAGEA